MSNRTNQTEMIRNGGIDEMLLSDASPRLCFRLEPTATAFTSLSFLSLMKTGVVLR